MKKYLLLVFFAVILQWMDSFSGLNDDWVGRISNLYGTTQEVLLLPVLVEREAPQNPQISRSGFLVTISWDSDPNAIAYKVYSCDTSNGVFTEDLSGVFNLTTWTASFSYAKRFYYVKSVYADAVDDFVHMQGGTFSPNGTYTVTLSSLYIDKYEVTQTSYQTVMGANPSYHTTVTNAPLEKTNWFKTIEYCNRLSVIRGLIPCYTYSTYGTDVATWPAGWSTTTANQVNISCNWSANGYRLLTEMEWEYAARGGALTHGYAYSGSNTQGDVAWYQANSGGSTHTVGTKNPNELGLYDMNGNVREWVWDAHYFQYPTGSYTNPTGATPATTSSRVYRGGDWNTSSCSITGRYSIAPTSISFYQGFRICRKAF